MIIIDENPSDTYRELNPLKGLGRPMTKSQRAEEYIHRILFEVREQESASYFGSCIDEYLIVQAYLNQSIFGQYQCIFIIKWIIVMDISKLLKKPIVHCANQGLIFF